MIFLLSGCSAETNDEPKKVEDASHNQETAQNEQTKEASNDEKLFQNDEEPQDTIALVDYTRFFQKKMRRFIMLVKAVRMQHMTWNTHG